MITELLSKTVEPFLLPLGAALLILAISLFRKRNILVAVALTLLWAFSTPAISDRLMSSLEDRFIQRSATECPRSDAAFVFGGMVGLRDKPGSGISWNEAADRFEMAVDLYKAGAAQYMVLSGGPPRYAGGPNEGQVLKQRALTMGVPERAILVTEETYNTADEARALNNLVLLRKWKRVLIVTSAYHMPRALRLLAGCVAELVPVPVAYETPDPTTSWAYRRPEYYLPQAKAMFISERALREYGGIVVHILASIL